MDRRQRWMLDQLTPEQRAWLDTQQVVDFTWPYFTQPGGPSYPAQTPQALQPQKAKRVSLLGDEQPAVGQPQAAKTSSFRQPNPGYYYPASVYSAVNPPPGGPVMGGQPGPLLRSQPRTQSAPPNNGGNSTAYWTQHRPPVSVLPKQSYQDYLFEQRRLEAHKDAYLGSAPRYIKEKPPVSPTIPPVGPWLPGQNVPKQPITGREFVNRTGNAINPWRVASDALLSMTMGLIVMADGRDSGTCRNNPN